MRYLLLTVAIVLLMFASGCGDVLGPLDPNLVNRLAGSWSGMLDYSVSGGVVTPMTMVLTKDGDTELDAMMTTGDAIYEDDFVAEVNDSIVMNFAVAGELWELVLEGTLSDTTFGGDIIQREAGEDDIILGSWSVNPA